MMQEMIGRIDYLIHPNTEEVQGSDVYVWVEVSQIEALFDQRDF